MKFRELDSFLPSLVQMAPPGAAARGDRQHDGHIGVGAGPHRNPPRDVAGLGHPLRFQHFPVRHVKGAQLKLLVAQRELLAELDFEGELRRSVAGRRGGSPQADGQRRWRRRPASVAALVNVSSFPTSSVKVARTWMV